VLICEPPAGQLPVPLPPTTQLALLLGVLLVEKAMA
jgi:hypothetical protein